jgi:hypothetical protein
MITCVLEECLWNDMNSYCTKRAPEIEPNTELCKEFKLGHSQHRVHVNPDIENRIKAVKWRDKYKSSTSTE